MTYTLSDLARFSGAKPRTIQFWALNGVLQSAASTKHAGTGNPRRYSTEETAVAIVVVQVAALSVKIGLLRDVAGYLREVFKFGSASGHADPRTAESTYWREVEEYQDRQWAIEAKWHPELERGLTPGAKRYLEAIRDKARSEIPEPVEPDRQLLHWASLQNALTTGTEVVGAATPDNDVILRFEVDDEARWSVVIREAKGYGEGSGPKLAPSIRTMAIHINLTRVMSPLRATLSQKI